MSNLFVDTFILYTAAGGIRLPGCFWVATRLMSCIKAQIRQAPEQGIVASIGGVRRRDPSRGEHPCGKLKVAHSVTGRARTTKGSSVCRRGRHLVECVGAATRHSYCFSSDLNLQRALTAWIAKVLCLTSGSHGRAAIAREPHAQRGS